MRRSLEYIAIGLVIGAAAGFVAGLLYAPATGAATRRRLAGGARRAAEAAKGFAEKAEEAAETLSGRVEHYLGREEELAWRRVREIREGLAGYTQTRIP